MFGTRKPRAKPRKTRAKPRKPRKLRATLGNETGKLNLFDSPNEYFPPLPISYF